MKKKIVHLFVQLTDAELRAKGKLQAQTMLEFAALEAERKDAVSGFALQMREKRKILDRVATEISTGLESRPVECELVPRWGDYTVVTIRRDTGEQVDTRSMTPHERQLEFEAFEPDEDEDETAGKSPH